MILLSTVVQALEAAGLIHGLALTEIHARLRTGLRLNDTGQRVLAFYLNELDVGRLYQASGHGSIAHFAETRLGLDHRRTGELVAVGKKLLTLPAIDHAFCTGVIGWSKVMLIVGVATPEHEEAWLERAKALSYRDLRLEVRLARPGSAPRGPGEMKGLPEIRFKLEASVGALTHQKLDLARQKLAAECGRVLNDTEFFDALAELCLNMEEDGSVPGKTRVDSSLFRIVLHPHGTLSDLVMDSEIGPLPVEGSEAIRCDALQVSAEGHVSAQGHVSPQGDVATAPGTKPADGHVGPETPAWLRRRVLTRDDNRCRSCRSRLRLMAHHIRYRSEQGPTSASNLITLCARCHGLVHEGLLVLEGEHAEQVRFVDRAGSPVTGPESTAAGTPALTLVAALAPAERPAETPPTTLDAIPAAIDRDWWRRHAHLVRQGGKGLEFHEGTPLPYVAPDEAAPAVAPATFDAVAMRCAFGGIVGQEALVSRLEVSVRGSLARGRPFPHTLLTGPAGTGKTTVAHALAAGFGRRLVKATGPLLQDVNQVLRLLADLGAGDVLFVEEVHAVHRPVLEALYEAISEGAFSITLREGVRERPVRFVLPVFTLVAATTEEGDLPTPFLGRFGLRECLGYYAKPVLAALVTKHAKAEGFTLEPGAAARLAEFARGTPREALRLLDRVLEDAASRNQKRLGGATAADALARLGYDAQGLAPLEQRYVSLLRGSVVPVPVARLGRLLGASVRTLLNEVEPFLFRLGLVDIGPRGRTAAHRPRLLEAHALA